MKIVLLFISFYTALFGLTLSESIEIAVKNSPQVSISKSNIKYNEYIKDEANSAYHPTLDAGFAWKSLENTTMFSFSPTHNYSLSLKYNLFNGFSDYSTINSKEYELQAAKLENISVIADLKLSVIKAYTDYLKAQKNIKTQEQQLASLTKQYDDTASRYELGIVAKNELLLIDVEKLRAEQTLIEAKSNLFVTVSNLEYVMGIEIEDKNSIADFNAEVSELDELASLEKQMFNNRSELKSMAFKSKSILSQKDAVKGNYLPKVNLEATHQVNDKERTSSTAIIQPEDQTTYGVNVSWNLYSGFADKSKQRALLEKDNQQNFLLHQLKLDLKNQLSRAYEDFKVAKSAKVVARKALESAQENYRISSDLYSYGKIDTLTLLVSQSNLTQAEYADNNAYYNVYIAYKTLQRIISE